MTKLPSKLKGITQVILATICWATSSTLINLNVQEAGIPPGVWNIVHRAT